MAKKFKLTTKYAAIIAIAVLVFIVFFATSGQTAQFRAAYTQKAMQMQLPPQKLPNLEITSVDVSGNSYTANVKNTGTGATPMGKAIWVDFSYSAKVTLQGVGAAGAIGLGTETKQFGGPAVAVKCQLPVQSLDIGGTSSCVGVLDIKTDITSQLDPKRQTMTGGTATVTVNVNPGRDPPESNYNDNTKDVANINF